MKGQEKGAIPLRVAIDCSHHLIPGGIRTYIENLLGAVATAGPDNEYLLCYRGLKAPEMTVPLPHGAASQVIHVKAPRRLLYGLENNVGWPTLERWTGDIDVVHGIHFTLPLTTNPSTTRVLTVHDVTYLRHPEHYSDTKMNDYGYRTLLGNSLQRVDAVIALSHSGKRDIVELCGIDPDRIWVIPHGLDPRLQKASNERVRRLCAQLEIESPFVLYPVGTLEPRKNFRNTLEAYARAFPDPGERPTLVLTGVGNAPDECFEVIDALGLSMSVRLENVGYPGELAALMTGARWGMYTSLYEGFGLPPLECMACGLPMLVSNRTSCPEVAGNAALIVDPTDVDAMAHHMQRLHKDSSLRSRLRKRGRERATSEAFHWSRAARQTLAVYRQDRAAFEREPQPLAEVPESVLA